MTPPILILGATSAIAQAYARRRAAEGAAFILVARHSSRLATVAADLVARGATSAETVVLDLAALDDIEKSVQTIHSCFGQPGEILLAYGMLADQSAIEHDFAYARLTLNTNFTSAVLWVLACLAARNQAAKLTVIVIGSVAGDRGRASNILYGAAKGGLDTFIEGLSQKYKSTPVRFVIVKPGRIDSPMTAKFIKRGLLWASPDRVASDICRAIEHRMRVVYSPRYWRGIMIIVRHLPWCIFKHLRT
jgi:decaprenylphospho-beta-D-erythro-pentofuranosid-2-ulose 2-reductase